MRQTTRSSPHLTNILPPPVWIWPSLTSEIIPPHRLSLWPWFPLVVSLILASCRALLGPRSGFLAPLVQQRVAGGVDVFDFHLVVIHTHGGQSTGHLLLWQEDRRVSGRRVRDRRALHTLHCHQVSWCCLKLIPVKCCHCEHLFLPPPPDDRGPVLMGICWFSQQIGAFHVFKPEETESNRGGK